MNNEERKEYLKMIGNRIRRLRVGRGMSQDELAKRSGFKSRSSINKIELGVNGVTLCKSIEIAEALGVSVSEIL